MKSTMLFIRKGLQLSFRNDQSQAISPPMNGNQSCDQPCEKDALEGQPSSCCFGACRGWRHVSKHQPDPDRNSKAVQGKNQPQPHRHSDRQQKRQCASGEPWEHLEVSKPCSLNQHPTSARGSERGAISPHPGPHSWFCTVSHHQVSPAPHFFNLVGVPQNFITNFSGRVMSQSQAWAL